MVINIKPDVQVNCKDGIVNIKTKSPLSTEESLIKKIQQAAMAVKGVKKVFVDVKLTDPVD